MKYWQFWCVSVYFGLYLKYTRVYVALLILLVICVTGTYLIVSNMFVLCKWWLWLEELVLAGAVNGWPDTWSRIFSRFMCIIFHVITIEWLFVVLGTVKLVMWSNHMTCWSSCTSAWDNQQIIGMSFLQAITVGIVFFLSCKWEGAPK